MKKKSGGIRASVQLSMGEYIETFASLVHEHYQRAMSDEELFSALNLTEEAQAQFSVEYATVLLVIASLAFKVKPKLTTDKYRDRIQERMADSSFRKILTDADDETIAACVTFYQTKKQIFSEICKNIYSTAAANRQRDIVGFARMLVAQVHPDDEEANLKAVERIGILLSGATDTFITLVSNSVQDSIRMDGKPTFAVLK